MGSRIEGLGREKDRKREREKERKRRFLFVCFCSAQNVNLYCLHPWLGTAAKVLIDHGAPVLSCGWRL